MKWNTNPEVNLNWNSYTKYVKTRSGKDLLPPWALYESEFLKAGINPYLAALRSAELTNWYRDRSVWENGDLFGTGLNYRLMRMSCREFIAGINVDDEVSDFVKTEYEGYVDYAAGIVYAPELESPSVPVEPPANHDVDPTDGVQPGDDVPIGGSFPLKTIIGIATAISAILGIASFFIPALAPIASIIKGIVSLLSGLGG